MKHSYLFSIMVTLVMMLCLNSNVCAQDSYTVEQPYSLLAVERDNGATSYQQNSTLNLQTPAKYHKNNKTFSFIAEARLICNMPYDAGVSRKKAIVCPSACDLGYNFSFGVQINDQFFIGGGLGFDWHRIKLRYAQYLDDHGYSAWGWGESSYDDLYATGEFEYGKNAELIADWIFDAGILHRKLRTIMDFYADFRWEPDFSSSVIPTVGVKAGFGLGGLYGLATVHFVFRPFVGVMYKITDDHKIFLNLEYT